MYTDQMRRVMRSLDHQCPKGFSVEIVDNDTFLSIRVDPVQLSKLDDFSMRRAAEYLYKLKTGLEDQGAIVLLIRKALGD